MRRVIRLSVLLGALALMLVLAPATAPANAQDALWHAEYFNNPTLSGTPTCVLDEVHNNHWWELGGPENCPGVGVDNFSVRWTRRYDFEEGLHRFYAASDDGVRIYIDGNVVLSDWRLRQAGWTYTEAYIKGGSHEVRIEYFDGGSNAEIDVQWELVVEERPPRGIHLTENVVEAVTSAAAAPGQAVGGGWLAEYYNNRYLQGNPVLTRNEPNIDYNWGYRSPAPGIINPGYFSVRWTQTVNFPPGKWEFNLQTDDGARLYIDDQLVINAWYPQWLHYYKRTRDLSGAHTIRLEYFEQEELAIVRLKWKQVGVPTPEPVTVIGFSADRNQILEGECITFSWNVENARSAYFEGRWVNLVGTRRECPTTSKEYALRVVKTGGGEETMTVPIVVLPNPALITFTADRTSIAPGECATLSWNVQNGTAAYYQGQWVNLVGSHRECPTATQTYRLRVVKKDRTEETREVTITVGSATVPIIEFTADRTQINAGECVNISWRVEFIREVYYQGGGVSGSGTRSECPATTTTYTLRVVKQDSSEENRFITIVVGGGTAGGDVQVTLSWNNTANLDLYVTDPNGFVIHHASPIAPSGGRLERNANSPCSVAAAPAVENIYWPTGTAPSGGYSVKIQYTGECASEGVTTYTLVVKNNGATLTTQSGNISPGASLTVYTFSR